MTRATRAQVDLAALRHNLAVARDAAPESRVVAVIKSNGYGHGLLQVAGALRTADAFAVTCLEEARPLREAGYRQPILLLGGLFEAQELAECRALGLDMVVHHDWQLQCLEQAPPGEPLTVWLKVDSGMHRLGFHPERAAEVHRRLSDCPAVHAVRLMTHLACADDRDSEYTPYQLDEMDRACAGLAGERSLANSAGTLAWPSSHGDWVRPGIMLYGASPFCDERPERPPLRPVMTLQSQIMAVSRRRVGDLIGYGSTYRCPEDMLVGVVAIGYGDGYPRHAPSGTPVLVDGQPAVTVGRVSMDLLCVDLRQCPDARVGSTVTLWGEGLPAETVARYAGTIAYELFCQVTARVPMHYTDSEPHGQGA